MKIAIAVVVVLVLVVAAALAALAWRASSRAINPGPPQYAWSLADYPELKPEDVRVETSTGATLAGRFFPGRERATVVLTHGYGGGQDEMLPVADALHHSGFTVFTYNLRGEATFGAKEQDDLVSVIDYLSGRSDVDAERIGALGFSMGAATTIMAAAREPRIRAVVADSAWRTAKSWLRPSWNPRDHFSRLSLKFSEWRVGIDLDELRPVDSMQQLVGRPVLLIHGSEDDVVFPEDSDALASAGPGSEVWRIPGAKHGETLAPGGPTTSERVTEFFARALT
jgi:dipeptidyl aminopeptidase/acylaminoacyl peptidase